MTSRSAFDIYNENIHVLLMIMDFTRHKKITYWEDIFGLHIGKIYEDYDYYQG